MKLIRLLMGFSMTFGLIAVDRKTQTRYPKESLAFWEHTGIDKPPFVR